MEKESDVRILTLDFLSDKEKKIRRSELIEQKWNDIPSEKGGGFEFWYIAGPCARLLLLLLLLLFVCKDTAETGLVVIGRI